MKRVEIRPIDTDKWHGYKGKDSFARSKKYSALVDPVNMIYATGLTKEEEAKYGQKLKQDLSNQYVEGEAHPFWDSPMGTVKLENKTMFLNPDVALDFVKIKFLKESKFVANSMKEYDEGHYPEATHVIYDESEELEVRATQATLRQKATIEQSKLTDSRKRQILLILTGKDMKEQSPDYLNVEMEEQILNDPQEVLRYIQQDKESVTNHATVLEALQKGVLRKNGHKITYNGSNIGGDPLDAADYLGVDENQELKLRIIQAINK